MSSNSSKTDDDAIYEFGKYWEKVGKFRWFGETIAIFEANVEYDAKNHIRNVVTKCYLYHDGRVELAEANWLNNVDHYLGFNTNWQDMTLSDDYELVIEGRGPKLPEGYVVTIVPK